MNRGNGWIVSRLASGAWLLLLGLLIMVAAAQTASAADPARPADGQAFLARVNGLEAAGEISAEQALLYRFHYGFAPDRLPDELRPVSLTPLKSGTPLILEYRRQAARLSPATRAIIDDYLAERPATRATETYISPAGIFRLTYETAGTDAVPQADVDPANGVPDFVEKIALYFDTSWDVEFTQLGFSRPPRFPYYEVTFEQMNYYGYTSWVSGVTTQIFMHNTYLGFPANMDPEGNQWGAAKVTAAHELKHASQLPQSDWTEGQWLELDAVWTEDLVFDQVNDYYNYFGTPNNISSPGLPLDHGGTGTYEDSIWQHWMSETWGNQIIVDFGEWRSDHQTQSVMDSYVAVLQTYSPDTSFPQLWATYSAWNYATGSRAIAGLGYGEAAGYPTAPTVANLSTYPADVSGSVAHLAADFVHCRQLSSADGWVSYAFNGGTKDLGLAAVIRKTDGTGLIEIITTDESADAAGHLSVPRQEIASLGFVVGNSALGGNAQPWTLTVDVQLPDPLLVVNTDALDITLPTGTTADHQLVLTNDGAAGSQLEFRAVVQNLATSLPDKSIAGTSFTCSVSEYEPGTTMDLEFTVTNGSTDDEWLTDVQITFPAGVTVNTSTDFTGGGGGAMVSDGTTGEAVQVSWHGDSGSPNYWGVVGNGQTARATVNVTFDAALSSDLTLDYQVEGDVWGATPHVITDTMVLTQQHPELTMLTPAAGDMLAIGETVELTWTSLGDPGPVTLELSRDGGYSWNLIAEDTANDGSFDWLVTGVSTEAALVRVSAAGGVINDVSPGLFTIFLPVDWVTITPSNGVIDQGQDLALNVNVDATGRPAQTYGLVLSLLTNAPEGVTDIPLTVHVQGVAAAGDVPRFRLHSNYPNPFNPLTVISFALPQDGPVTVDVLDVRGALVKRLWNQPLTAGDHQLRWNGTDARDQEVAAGVYLVRVVTRNNQATGKMVLAK